MKVVDQSGGGGSTLKDWVTSASYEIGDDIIESGNVYTCLIAHIGGVFATDLTANKWVLAIGYTSSDVKTLYEANTDTNEFDDAEQTKLGNIGGTNTGDESQFGGTSGVAGANDGNVPDDGIASSGRVLLDDGTWGTASIGDMVGANNLSDLASAPTSRTNLGVDAAGTDNSTNVSLGGAPSDTTDDTLDLAGQSLTVNLATPTTDGAMSGADKSKLNGIEALADVTDSANVDSAGATMNTDADVSSNAWLDDSVTSTGKVWSSSKIASEIISEKSYQGGYDASTNTPLLDVTPIAGILKGDVYDVTVAGTFFTIPVEIGDTIRSSKDAPTLEGDWVIVQGNLTAASIKTQYESNANTNEYDDAEQSKLAGIEASATADQSDAEIKTAYENNADTNEYSDAEQTKVGHLSVTQAVDLDTMESNIATNNSKVSADGLVTTHSDVDASTLANKKNNLNAAVAPVGATDDTTLGYEVGSMWFDTTADKGYVCLDNTDGAAVWTEITEAGSGIANVVEDTTPQLGGLLDANAFSINESEGVAITSVGGLPDIFNNTDGNTIHIEGTTTITDFPDAPRAGIWRKVIFDGILTLTHGAAAIVVPGGASITTAANDWAYVYAESTTLFRVIYFRADGTALVGGGGGPTEQVIHLAPEFAGAVFQGDGGSNDMDITAGHDATENENYYNATPDAGSTGTQDIDLYIMCRVPLDYSAWKASGIKIKMTSDDTATNRLGIAMVDTAGTSEGAAESITPANATIGTWETITFASTTFDGTYTDGETFIIKLTFTVAQAKNLRIGSIELAYDTE